MKSQQDLQWRNSCLTAVLLLTLLTGMVTHAAATPYEILIEDPGVWRITGSFDSDVETWTQPTDVTNWSFTSEVFASPPFSVGPFVDGTDSLDMLRGSLDTGIQFLLVQGQTSVGIPIPPRTRFQSRLDDIFYTVDIANPNADEFFDGSGVRSDITNKANVVPEPSTALLLLTGLTGLAGYQWRRSRRGRTPAGSHTFSSPQV